MAPWKRIYWTVWLSNLITSVGMMSFLPFFPGHLRTMGLEDPVEIATWTGLVFGAAPLMAAIMGPVWGAVGDAFGRRLMILRALFAIVLFVGLMTLARTPLELFLLRLCQGVFSGFVAPSITLVSVKAPAGIQGRVTGSLQTALALGTIVGPLAGAFVQGEVGMRGLFAGVATAVFVSALCVLLFVPDDRAELRERGELGSFDPSRSLSALGTFLRGMGEHFANPALRSTFAIVFVAQFAVAATLPQMELFVGELWTGEPDRITDLTALLFTAMAVADLLCMPLWGHLGDRRGHRRVIRFTAFLSGIALLLHAFVPVYAALLGARALLGVAGAGLKPCAFGVVAEETASDSRGGAIGLMLAARQLALSTAAMAGGVLFGLFGLRGMFLAGGVVLVIGGLVLVRSAGGALAPRPAR